jgi:hypothetical protein
MATVGERRVHSCGKYMKSAGAECNNNTVDAEALLRLTLRTCKQLLIQHGRFDELCKRIEQLAQAEHSRPTASIAEQEIEAITRRIATLSQERETIGARMAREQNDDRYAMIASEFDRVVAELRGAQQQLAEMERNSAPPVSEAVRVDQAMTFVENVLRVCDDSSARAELQPILKKLDLWIGLDFTSTLKGKKREVRRLTGGLFAFGAENLPVKLFGRDHVSENGIDHGQSPEIQPTTEEISHESVGITGPSSPLAPDTSAAALLSRPLGSTLRHQEAVSFTKVNRGDWI